MSARVLDIESLTLAKGAHNSFEAGACVMEAVSYIAGEPWSDHPKCVSPVLGAYARSLNDRLDDSDRQILKQYIPQLIGTAGDGKDEARRWLASNWAIRVATPRWLEAAGMTEHAERLRALPPIVDASTAGDARFAARTARDDAWIARRKSRQVAARIREELEKRGVAAAAAAVAAVVAADVVADGSLDFSYGSSGYWVIR